MRSSENSGSHKYSGFSLLSFSLKFSLLLNELLTVYTNGKSLVTMTGCQSVICLKEATTNTGSRSSFQRGGGIQHHASVSKVTHINAKNSCEISWSIQLFHGPLGHHRRKSCSGEHLSQKQPMTKENKNNKIIKWQVPNRNFGATHCFEPP